jgi:hypothetical protein
VRRTLALLALGCHVDVECRDMEAWALLDAHYAALRGPRGGAALRYTVGRCPDSSAFFLARERHVAWRAHDPGAFLYRFEHELTIALQRLRRDLYFVHAAVLDVSGQAVMLVGASGGGKSTTTWALLHHGCRYFSDELGPVDPTTLAVYPYPRALGLKAVPPGPYPLPPQTLATGRTLHIPTAAMPSGVGAGPAPLTAVFFVRYSPQAARPRLRPLRPAEAAAHLIAHALNPLAHPAGGLDGAIALTTGTACFALLTAELPATCGVILTALQGIGRG